MKRSMTLRSYLGWQKYWEEEPWGPWRDNLHTAILAREVRRSRVKPNTKIDMDQFMVRTPTDRKANAEEKMLAGLASVATPVSAEEGMRRMKAAKARVKRKGQSRSAKK
jgi:hypothetical protein